MKDNSGPAFPTIGYSKNASGAIDQLLLLGGLTKREYFAGQAMMGLLAGGYNVHEDIECARLAKRHADALLAELAKEEV